MKLLSIVIIVLSIFLNPIDTYADETVLAGGCFWCLEHDLESLKGINFAKSGYSGGDSQNPSYENHDGHQEVVLVNFDADLIKYEDILRVYFRNIDPLDGKGQFCDRGGSYRPVIFFENQDQEKAAQEALKSAAKELNQPVELIRVAINPRKDFWIAEDYHQDFADKNELKYKFYRFSCGRDKRLDQLWGINSKSMNEWSTDF